MKRIFDYLSDDTCIFEEVALSKLAQEGQLMSYIHTGFWQCMDNMREKTLLDKMIGEGRAPWIRW